MSELITHRCRMCEGVAHPATGCVYSSTFLVCWRCTLEFGKWLEAWTNSKGRRRGVSFSDHIRLPAHA